MEEFVCAGVAANAQSRTGDEKFGFRGITSRKSANPENKRFPQSGTYTPTVLQQSSLQTRANGVQSVFKPVI
jgi:hypothetical protein